MSRLNQLIVDRVQFCEHLRCIFEIILGRLEATGQGQLLEM